MNTESRSAATLRGFARALTLWLAVCLSMSVPARTYLLPDQDANVVGATQTVNTAYTDTFVKLARAYNQGYTDLQLANPDVDEWLPGEGTPFVVPSGYVLPDAQHTGIVINVPEMRLYFFPPAAAGAPRYVVTHPISIGRQDWSTPYGLTTIVRKMTDPAWYPPESIREEHAARGDSLPSVVPPGPDNPLGRHALYLGLSGYLIHGTNKPFGIGMRATHGCIRLFPEDIARLYTEVPMNTPVRIVNQPYKVGHDEAGRVFLEVHPYLEEHSADFLDETDRVIRLIVNHFGFEVPNARLDLNWSAVLETLDRRNGVPNVIGQLNAVSLISAAP